MSEGESRKSKKNEKRKQDIQSLGVEGPINRSQGITLKLALQGESWTCSVGWKDIARAVRAERKLEKKRLFYEREEALLRDAIGDFDIVTPEPPKKKPRTRTSHPGTFYNVNHELLIFLLKRQKVACSIPFDTSSMTRL